MECPLCRGPMELSHPPFTVDRKGYHIHWDQVPAWVCIQCGEPCFARAEVDRIQEALRALDLAGAALSPTS